MGHNHWRFITLLLAFFFRSYTTEANNAYLCPAPLGLSGMTFWVPANYLVACLPFCLSITHRQCWVCVPMCSIKDVSLLVFQLPWDANPHLRSPTGIILVEIQLDFLLECQSCTAVSKATSWWERHSFFAHIWETGVNLPLIVKVHCLVSLLFKPDLSGRFS